VAWTERYVSVAGGGAHDGTSAANAWTLAEAIAAYAAGQRLNVIAGTYANTTTSRTFSTAGTTTSPVWWRGYKTTIGDLDAQPATGTTRVAGTDIPSFTFTTGQMTISSGHQTFSNIDVNGAATAGAQLVVSGGSGVRLDRVRVENTAANAASSACSIQTSAGPIALRCWFKATTTATRCLQVAACGLAGCSVVGGTAGLDWTSGGLSLASCTVRSAGSHGFNFNASGSPLQAFFLTSYNNGGDGIRLATLPSFGQIVGCLLANNSGYGINNSTGTNTNIITRLANDFYSNTSGTENGFGDSPSLQEISESASPFNGTTDLGLVGAANARANGPPGPFENEAFSSYLDVGAVQRKEYAARARYLMGVR
jgi:hypothetical protein